jgi:hypothetical protein
MATTVGFQSGLRSMETTHKTMTVLRCKVVLVGDASVLWRKRRCTIAV